MTIRSKSSTAEQLGRLDERLKAVLDKLDDIHEEAKKTNGRVSSLEGWRHEIKGTWRATTFLTSIISSIVGACVGFLTSVIF